MKEEASVCSGITGFEEVSSGPTELGKGIMTGGGEGKGIALTWTSTELLVLCFLAGGSAALTLEPNETLDL